ncbi:MAG: FAD-binding oxidoreductase [Gemmatimonadaceae bacterium]|nr:FAD-binding oxidoreductase [Gemmatimonadaceae bacterium]NUR18359.1 FAD-binding oxidoreductase [Gemmatimonadaceae bacterium]
MSELSRTTGEHAGAPLWAEDAPALELPVLRDELTADVCVVGLGGSGLSCVRELRRAGVSVIGVDAGSVGGGAAGRNGGFLLAGIAAFHHDATSVHGRERATRAWRLTLAELERIAGETPEAVRRTGSLRIAIDDEELADCEAQRAAMHVDGLPVERYDGPEGRGLLFPRDASFQPLLRCRMLAREASAAGARLFERSKATRIGEGEVVTAKGRVRAGAIVVAVDGGLERVLPELAERVRTVQLQMLGTAPAADVDYPRPVYSRYGLDYWQQLPDRRIVLGGFRDVGGEEEWTHDARPTPRVQRALEQCLRERVKTRAPITHRWAAPVSFSTDGMPVVEQVRPRVWAAGAYSGTGNVVGALCGRAVAQLVTQGTSDLLL